MESVVENGRLRKRGPGEASRVWRLAGCHDRDHIESRTLERRYHVVNPASAEVSVQPGGLVRECPLQPDELTALGLDQLADLLLRPFTLLDAEHEAIPGLEVVVGLSQPVCCMEFLFHEANDTCPM
jgi:hypothetical protein